MTAKTKETIDILATLTALLLISAVALYGQPLVVWLLDLY